MICLALFIACWALGQMAGERHLDPPRWVAIPLALTLPLCAAAVYEWLLEVPML